MAALAFLSIMMTITSCRNEQVITFRSLLGEMAGLENLTRYPDPSYRLVQFSSYDRRSIHPDSAGWYANNDYTQFIREETTDGRREFVMLETEGPGAVVRWWMTFGNSDALNSYIRVYVDGRTEPVLEGMAPQLVGEEVLAPAPLSTSVSPLTEPQRRGYNLYLPIPFAGKCKITLENDSVLITAQRRSPSIYYNIDARLYEEGTRVMSVKRETFNDDTLAIRECASVLMMKSAGGKQGMGAGDEEVKSYGAKQGMGAGEKEVNSSGLKQGMGAGVKEVNSSGVGNNEMKKSLDGQIAPGTGLSLTVSGRGLAINGFSLRLTAAAENAVSLKGTVIRLFFDGRQTAEVPAGNFFGTGYSYSGYNTRFTSADADWTLHSSWLMPFRDSCRVVIFNRTDDTITVSSLVSLTRYKWDEKSMHFGASFRDYPGFETAGSEHTGGTGLHTDLNIADLKGRGLYVGDSVS